MYWSAAVSLGVVIAASIAAFAFYRFAAGARRSEAALRSQVDAHEAVCKTDRTLHEANRILHSSLNHTKTLTELSEFLASDLCGACAILLAGETQLQQLCASFSDTGLKPVFDQTVSSEAMLRVMKTGRADLSEGGVLAPLPTQGKIVGILVAMPRAGRRFDAHETRCVEEIGRRAGLSLEHARLYEGAVEASRLKDEFIAIVSHELRTPLTPILGAVYMLRTEPSNPKIVGRALDLIERNAKAQSKIVEDLLDVSRIISGKLRLNFETVDLRALIDAAVETIRPATDGKNIELRLNLNPVNGTVYGDADRLQQVVWNLLANAAKFTPENGIITLELGEAGNSCAELRVTDTGIGIRPELLPHVFNRFQQGEDLKDRGRGGLGLGLAIVRHVIESHGGTVMAESSGTEKGATFTVKLPLRSQSLDEEKTARASS